LLKQSQFVTFDKSTVVKEYKEKIDELEKQNDKLAKKVGTLTIERDWLRESKTYPKKCSILLGTLSASLDFN